MFCEFNKAYGHDFHDTFQPTESCIKLVNREDNTDIFIDEDDDINIKTKKLTHRDCINKIKKGNCKDKKILKHVKKCKYCKNHLNKRKNNNKNAINNIEQLNKLNKLNNINNDKINMMNNMPKNNYSKEISICLSIIVTILIIGYIILLFIKNYKNNVNVLV